jgi:hypothetical protein
MSLMQWVRAKFTDVIHTRADLHDYQTDIAIPFLKENPFSLLLMDMGLGKSICSWTLIADLIDEYHEGKILIVGPKRVATQTWPNEKREWSHIAHLNHQLINVSDDHPSVIAAGKAAAAEARLNGMSGAEAQGVRGRAETQEKNRIRAIQARDPATVHIVSNDWLVWLVELHQHRWPYRTVFIDEASGFKDWQSERFKALAKVRKYEGYITRLHALTATPAAEGYTAFWSITFLLDRGKRFGETSTRFFLKYFNKNKYTRKYDLRPDADDEILAKIADVTLVMKADQYLPREKPTIIHRPVVLGEREMALYEEMQREFIVTLPDGSEVEAKTAAALSAKLLQMASGVLYETYLEEDIETDDMRKVKKVHHLHDQKIEELRELIEEAQGEPIIVAYHWRSSLDRLKKAFPQAVVMDKEGKCVAAWNKRKIPLLLMHPQSGGHGLNLQLGGHIMVLFDLFHSLERFMQLVGRIARQGQKHPVVVYMLTAVGTLDELVAKTIKGKEDAQAKMFAKLRRLIAAYRKQKLLVDTSDEL